MKGFILLKNFSLKILTSGHHIVCQIITLFFRFKMFRTSTNRCLKKLLSFYTTCFFLCFLIITWFFCLKSIIGSTPSLTPVSKRSFQLSLLSLVTLKLSFDLVQSNLPIQVMALIRDDVLLVVEILVLASGVLRRTSFNETLRKGFSQSVL